MGQAESSLTVAADVAESAFLGGRIRLRQPTKGYRAGMDAALLAAAVEATVWPWVASGAVRAQVEATFPLAEAAAAHAHLEAGAHVGKVVLLP